MGKKTAPEEQILLLQTPFLEGFGIQQGKQEVIKIVPLNKVAKNLSRVSIPLKLLTVTNTDKKDC